FRVVQVNVETMKVDALRPQKFCWRKITEGAKAFGVFLLHHGDQFVNKLGDTAGAAPADNVGRDFIDHADSKYRRGTGAALGRGSHGLPRCFAGSFRVEKANLFVPGNVDQKLEGMLLRQVEQPARRDVIDAQEIGAQLAHETKILDGLLRRAEMFTLKV